MIIYFELEAKPIYTNKKNGDTVEDLVNILKKYGFKFDETNYL